jgi:hypothetical protein
MRTYMQTYIYVFLFVSLYIFEILGVLGSEKLKRNFGEKLKICLCVKYVL